MQIQSRLIAFAFAATTLLMLVGCRTTVDAHWSNTDDTVDYWKKAMPKLPVEVRGALPDATNQQIAQAIPNAGSMPTNPAAPRLVVEVGHAAKPSDDGYCAKSAEASSKTGPQTTITLAVCDGSRLVVTSSKALNPATTPASELAKQVESLKKLALIGIARSRTDEYQIQG
jgi:hypothetical protein